MSDSREKFLKPVRELCQNLENSNSVEKLKQYVVKDKFYESNVIGILIDFLESNVERKDSAAIAGAFEIMSFIIDRGIFTKSVLVRLYNYSIREKVRIIHAMPKTNPFYTRTITGNERKHRRTALQNLPPRRSNECRKH
jgi:hypothetical protein